MNCARILNKLDDYVDGRLDDPARKEVERHVNQCLDCAKALEEDALVPRVLIDQEQLILGLEHQVGGQELAEQAQVREADARCGFTRSEILEAESG